MSGAINLRAGSPGDADALGRLYRDVFPEENLVPLVRQLINARPDVFSMVVVAEGALVAHIAFTTCGVSGSAEKVVLLGPLAVAKGVRNQGVASALIEAGVERLRSEGVVCLLVLGDPAFYGRFGFAPHTGIEPPYPLPEEWRDAWQVLALHPDDAIPEGTLIVPEPWRQKTLWAD